MGDDREDDSGEDGGVESGGRRSGGETWTFLEMGDVIKGNWLGGDDGNSVDGGGMDGGSDRGNGILCERGISRRLASSHPSLSNSTSH